MLVAPTLKSATAAHWLTNHLRLSFHHLRRSQFYFVVVGLTKVNTPRAHVRFIFLNFEVPFALESLFVLSRHTATLCAGWMMMLTFRLCFADVRFRCSTFWLSVLIFNVTGYFAREVCLFECRGWRRSCFWSDTIRCTD